MYFSSSCTRLLHWTGVGHTCLSVNGRDRGLLHPSHICALLQFLEVPHKHWPLAVESTVLALVNAFYFLLRVLFGGLSGGGLCETGLGYAEQEAEASDSSDLEDSKVGKLSRLAGHGMVGVPWDGMFQSHSDLPR
jgi:hypothetical protein